MSITKLILASNSPARLEIMKNACLSPDSVISTNTDETIISEESPKNYCKRIALAKFHNAVKEVQFKDAIIITADTVGIRNSKLMLKPKDENEFLKFIQNNSGKRHRIYTAVVCGKIKDGNVENKLMKQVESIVCFNKLSLREIEFYFTTKEGLDKSGGYSAQGIASRYVKFISGSFSNIVGLPIFETYQMLKSLGYKVNM
jgi:septum formation protein